MPRPICLWLLEDGEWRLYVGRRKRYTATVWSNGAWHTWDRDGNGGENSQEQSVYRAKIEAAGSAIRQGFI